MKILIGGGSGNVASWTMAFMMERHEFRVMNLRPARSNGAGSKAAWRQDSSGSLPTKFLL